MENQLKTVCSVPEQPVFCFYGTSARKIPAAYPQKPAKNGLPGEGGPFYAWYIFKKYEGKNAFTMTNHTQKATDRMLISLTEEYRRNVRPNLKGGVVVIHKKHVTGWMNQLRDPQNWKPGCYAVNEDGRIWMTVGGSPDDGATSWEPWNERV